MPTDDRVADYLTAVELRAENVRNCPQDAPDAMWRSIHKRSAADSPRLLAAVEAALAPHHPVAGDWGVSCGGCWGAHGSRPVWPCPTVQAITAALLPGENPAATVPEPAPASLADEVAEDQAGAGGSMNPTPDCGGARKPPGATEVWWCDAHREFHGTPPAEEDGNG